MKIIAYKDLDDHVLNEILRIERVCKEYDNLRGYVFLDPSENFDRDINCYFLLYEDNVLISILTMLIPTRQEAEISAFTLPEFRRKGNFTKLLARAVKELKKNRIEDMLFVCERQSAAGIKVIAALNAQFAFAEYLMKFNRAEYVPVKMFRLSINRAQLRDLKIIIEITMKIFNESFEEAQSRVEDCFESDQREQYYTVLDNKIVGLCSVNLEEDEVSIYALGILPEYRSRGFGKELLCLIVDSLLRRGITKMRLMVYYENTQAINLYQKFGFQTAATLEYYRKKVNDLEKIKAFPGS